MDAATPPEQNRSTPFRHALLPGPIGELTLVAQGEALAGLYFPTHRYPPPEQQIGPLVELNNDNFLNHVAQELHEYFAGTRDQFTVALATAGDTFSERVWALLKQIPYGHTTSYGALARELGNVHLSQQVGQAVGHNPISIVIPCHRVVGSDGSLTGFGGGLERKRFLLELEEPAEAKAARLF